MLLLLELSLFLLFQTESKDVFGSLVKGKWFGGVRVYGWKGLGTKRWNYQEMSFVKFKKYNFSRLECLRFFFFLTIVGMSPSS